MRDWVVLRLSLIVIELGHENVAPELEISLDQLSDVGCDAVGVRCVRERAERETVGTLRDTVVVNVSVSVIVIVPNVDERRKESVSDDDGENDFE